MASAAYNVVLLFFCKADKLNGITGNADCKVCIFRFFRVSLCIFKFFNTEYVDVQVVRTLLKVAVKDSYKFVGAFRIIVSECARVDCLRIGNTVKRVFVRNFRNGIKRSKKSALFGSVRRICARSKRSTGFASVRKRTCSFSVNNV